MPPGMIADEKTNFNYFGWLNKRLRQNSTTIPNTHVQDVLYNLLFSNSFCHVIPWPVIVVYSSYLLVFNLDKHEWTLCFLYLNFLCYSGANLLLLMFLFVCRFNLHTCFLRWLRHDFRNLKMLTPWTCTNILQWRML